MLIRLNNNNRYCRNRWRGSIIESEKELGNTTQYVFASDRIRSDRTWLLLTPCRPTRTTQDIHPDTRSTPSNTLLSHRRHPHDSTGWCLLWIGRIAWSIDGCVVVYYRFGENVNWDRCFADTILIVMLLFVVAINCCVVYCVVEWRMFGELVSLFFVV